MEVKIEPYGSEFRNHERFGYGLQTVANLKANTKEAFEAEAIRLGWSNGCPRARNLIGPNSEYGLEWMIQRYAETNFWFRRTLGIAKFNNPAVRQWLLTPRPRLMPSEPMGDHEPISVPNSHQFLISPMSGVEGYATPRVAIEIARLKRGTNSSQAAEMISLSANLAGNQPDTFLPFLAEWAINTGVQPEAVLHHVYPQGILDEENCRTTYIALAGNLERYAPDLWKSYGYLSAKEKRILQIADVPKSAKS